MNQTNQWGNSTFQNEENYAKNDFINLEQQPNDIEIIPQVIEEDDNEVALDLEVNQKKLSLSFLNKIGDKIRVNDLDPTSRAVNYKADEPN